MFNIAREGKKKTPGLQRHDEEKKEKNKKRFAQPAKGFGAGPLSGANTYVPAEYVVVESRTEVVGYRSIDPQRRQFDPTVAPRRPCLPDDEKRKPWL